MRIAWISLVGLAVVLLVGAAVAPSIVGRLMNRTLDGASGPVGERARALQESLAVADLHADALLWNRDLLSRGSWGHVDVPRLVEGRVALQVFTTVTKTPRGMNIESNAGDSDNITFLAVLQRWPRRTWSSLLERALYQAAKLRTFAAMSDGRLTVVRTRGELAEYIAGRMADDSVTAGILGVEGAQALDGELTNVNRLFLAGFRLIGLAHFFDTDVGGSAHGLAKGGLTPFGRQVVERMEGLGIVVDLAHASPALIDDVLAIATRPVIVSHTGVKGTCDNARNLDDDRLAAVAATGGVVGIGLWDTAVCGTAPADWARAVRHAVEVVGVEHVGLGSDWDGSVAAILDASQTIHLTQALVDEGFTDGDIRLIMGGNVLRVFSLTLPD